MNIYKKLNTGHVFQSIKTGPMPDYSEQYSKTRYDTYTTTDKMSELRYISSGAFGKVYEVKIPSLIDDDVKITRSLVVKKMEAKYEENLREIQQSPSNLFPNIFKYKVQVKY